MNVIVSKKVLTFQLQTFTTRDYLLENNCLKPSAFGR